MLGRFIAGILTIAFVILLSVKNMGVRENKRSEDSIAYALELFVEEAKITGRISLDDYELLLNRVSFSGEKCLVGIKVGTIVHGIYENYIEAISTEEVLEWLGKSDSSVDVRGRMITLYAIPLEKGLGSKLANLVWESITSKKIIVFGDYIHG